MTAGRTDGDQSVVVFEEPIGDLVGKLPHQAGALVSKVVGCGTAAFKLQDLLIYRRNLVRKLVDLVHQRGHHQVQLALHGLEVAFHPAELVG